MARVLLQRIKLIKGDLWVDTLFCLQEGSCKRWTSRNTSLALKQKIKYLAIMEHIIVLKFNTLVFQIIVVMQIV